MVPIDATEDAGADDVGRRAKRGVASPSAARRHSSRFAGASSSDSLLDVGKVAVVTGASSGIGVEIARLLAARGDLCILLARRADRLEALAEELGGEAEPCDVSDRAAVESVAARVLERHPKIDLLVNNAGDPGPDALPRRRSRGDRAADPDQLPRLGLGAARLPAGPARGGAVGRRQHRLGLGRRRRPAERPLLRLEARPARLLAHGRGRAARRRGSACTRSSRASPRRRDSRRNGSLRASSAW